MDSAKLGISLISQRHFSTHDTLRPSLNFWRFRFCQYHAPEPKFWLSGSSNTIFAICFSPSLFIHFAGEHTGVFSFVHLLSLDLKGITTIARGSVDETTATSDTAPAYTMATSGHVDDDDGNGDAVTEARTMTQQQQGNGQHNDDEHDDGNGRYYAGQHNDDRDGQHNDPAQHW